MIRHAVFSDAERLAEIEAASYPAAEGASLQAIQKRILAYPEHFWILEKEEGIVAFVNGMCTNERDLQDRMYEDAGMHREDGSWQMIFSVVTAPEQRHRGYASEVLKQVIADAGKDGRLGVVLTCKEKLLAFYAQFGFLHEGISASVHGNVQWHQMRLTF